MKTVLGLLILSSFTIAQAATVNAVSGKCQTAVLKAASKVAGKKLTTSDDINSMDDNWFAVNFVENEECYWEADVEILPTKVKGSTAVECKILQSSEGDPNCG